MTKRCMPKIMTKQASTCSVRSEGKILTYILAYDRSELTLTVVTESMAPNAYSLHSCRNMSLKSLCINLDTLFCLIESMTTKII